MDWKWRKKAEWIFRSTRKRYHSSLEPGSAWSEKESQAVPPEIGKPFWIKWNSRITRPNNPWSGFAHCCFPRNLGRPFGGHPAGKRGILSGLLAGRRRRCRHYRLLRAPQRGGIHNSAAVLIRESIKKAAHSRGRLRKSHMVPGSGLISTPGAGTSPRDRR